MQIDEFEKTETAISTIAGLLDKWIPETDDLHWKYRYQNMRNELSLMSLRIHSETFNDGID